MSEIGGQELPHFDTSAGYCNKSPERSNCSKSDEEASWPLGKDKFITIREFHNKSWVDVRQFVHAVGAFRPSKTGIMLNMKQWEKMRSILSDINSRIEFRRRRDDIIGLHCLLIMVDKVIEIKKQNSPESDSGEEDCDPPIKKLIPSLKGHKEFWSLGSNKFVRLCKIQKSTSAQRYCVDICELHHITGKSNFSRKGISLNLDQWSTFVSFVDEIDSAIKRRYQNVNNVN